MLAFERAYLPSVPSPFKQMINGCWKSSAAGHLGSGGHLQGVNFTSCVALCGLPFSAIVGSGMGFKSIDFLRISQFLLNSRGGPKIGKRAIPGGSKAAMDSD